ncbi:hypothetical protein CPB84DRAFT_1842173 [Gymnopilus junonius]|uniref:Uncharacterized protein n=1 Tax=Gymnopilus junonius TaxID=109634 RepID=A0A9P5P0M6_GYMJU|nr:hypothetical protein CPB84DRAFT_1842173 [Gymnopilus junonius]
MSLQAGARFVDRSGYSISSYPIESRHLGLDEGFPSASTLIANATYSCQFDNHLEPHSTNTTTRDSSALFTITSSRFTFLFIPNFAVNHHRYLYPFSNPPHAGSLRLYDNEHFLRLLEQLSTCSGYQGLRLRLYGTTLESKSEQLFTALNALKADPDVKNCILDVRGRGLMVGVEFGKGDGYPANLSSLVAKKCIEKGLLILTTSIYEVVRFIPPLNISEEDMKKGIDIFVESVKEVAKSS